jgi:predicted metal-dependent enzyme (double-stranded beta helix superfamily)
MCRNYRAIIDSLARRAVKAVHESDDPLDRIQSLEGAIASAVKDPYWLAAPFRRVQGPGSYYLLWRDQESDVSLIAMVLGPRDSTPIHDHLTWGVVGVYEGLQHETRYVDRSGGLEESLSRLRRPGDVTYILPPENDIHFISNQMSNGSAISVFVMGSNMGCRPRHRYVGEIRETVVSGYANVSCPAETRNPHFVSQFM